MKICSAPLCYSPRFGGGFCLRHQYLRTDKKPKKLTFRKPEKKKSELSFGFESQQEMFSALWENAKDKNGRVVCPFTGEVLNSFYGTDMWYSCFAHVLPKGRYTYFKLNPDNVCVVYPDFHKIIDQGTKEDRAGHPTWKFELWDLLVYDLKQKYEWFKKKNMLS